MRYSDDHAARTREKVLKTAAAQLRKEGPKGVSVAGIMSAAGLTHGGFYAHFRSKDELIAGAIDTMFGDSGAKWARFTQGLEGTAALAAFIDRYVSALHRDNPETGCPVPTLASDLPRLRGAARANYDKGVKRMEGLIASLLPADRKEIAGSLLCEMIGAVVLSRAVSDGAASDRFLSEARRALKARAGCATET